MLEEITMRRSIRKYSNKSVEDEKIIKLLECGRLAPSGSNTQPWHFIIVKSELNRQNLSKIAHDPKWMLSAPVFIVCVADIRCRIEDKVDILLNENSSQEEIRPLLNIPNDKYVVGIITIGYANESPIARPRKKIEEITHYEVW